MEEIDIETLNFDEYNREVYSENHSKLDNSHLIDAQKRYKNMIDKFVEKFNTSNVDDMGKMFNYAGENATMWNIGNLSNWNTSQVTDMGYMFYRAGYNATTFNLNLSNWNTSKVTNMSSMFTNAGYNSTNFSITIPRTNGNGINNDTTHLYGSTTSTYADPPSSRTFTIATS